MAYKDEYKSGLIAGIKRHNGVFAYLIDAKFLLTCTWQPDDSFVMISGTKVQEWRAIAGKCQMVFLASTRLACHECDRRTDGRTDQPNYGSTLDVRGGSCMADFRQHWGQLQDKTLWPWPWHRLCYPQIFWTESFTFYVITPCLKKRPTFGLL